MVTALQDAHRGYRNEGNRVYRPEIDGLRAIAVAAVIANQLGSNLLPGGYFGIDVFFVISGYVIGASLAVEVDR